MSHRAKCVASLVTEQYAYAVAFRDRHTITDVHSFDSQHYIWRESMVQAATGHGPSQQQETSKQEDAADMDA